jgi:lipid II:glycine glycyltransferase (peptidoglycan interpeptide bridge formation enzyme)
MIKDKALYINLCSSEDSIPLFMQKGWLDAVMTEGSSWDVALSKDDNGDISAALVFILKKKWGFTVISEPLLSPFCGVWIKHNPHQKQHEQYHFVKKTLDALIKQLPHFHYANFRFSTALTDWQPFYWAGFQQTTRYTYQLDLTKEENLQKQFNQNTQRNIRKGALHFKLSTSNEIDTLLTISNLTFERQQLKSPIPYSVWQRLDAFLKENNQRTLYTALNTEGSVEAAIYIVYDKKTAYYLAGGATATGRKYGAMHFLINQAIEDAQKQGIEIFDFEGSMLHGVEAFFRGFNPVLTPYFSVWKYSNRFLSFIDSLRKS